MWAFSKQTNKSWRSWRTLSAWQLRRCTRAGKSTKERRLSLKHCNWRARSALRDTTVDCLERCESICQSISNLKLLVFSSTTRKLTGSSPTLITRWPRKMSCLSQWEKLGWKDSMMRTRTQTTTCRLCQIMLRETRHARTTSERANVTITTARYRQKISSLLTRRRKTRGGHRRPLEHQITKVNLLVSTGLSTCAKSTRRHSSTSLTTVASPAKSSSQVSHTPATTRRKRPTLWKRSTT